MPEFQPRLYFEMGYREFDEWVQEKLGREYECVSQNQWDNYSCYSYHIKEAEIPTKFFMEYTLPEVERWINGEDESISADEILEYLCYKKLIPAGNYLIDVSW